MCECCEADVRRAALAYVRAVDADDDVASHEVAERWDLRHLTPGLLLVALGLLDALRDHRGCDCGSAEWLERWALQLAGETS